MAKANGSSQGKNVINATKTKRGAKQDGPVIKWDEDAGYSAHPKKKDMDELREDFKKAFNVRSEGGAEMIINVNDTSKKNILNVAVYGFEAYIWLVQRLEKISFRCLDIDDDNADTSFEG